MWMQKREGRATTARHTTTGMAFGTINTIAPKYHGIELTNAEGTEQQWKNAVNKMIRRIDDDARVFQPRSVQGRASLAEMRYIAKVAYAFKYQVPEPEIVREVLQIAQDKIDTLVIGKRTWVKKELARQRKEDGGIALPDIRTHMAATWAHTIRKLADPQRRPWKHFARYYIRKHYGEELAQTGTRLLTAN